jgi:hypothetical protein
MTYWDGNRWIHDEPAAPRRGRARRRLLGASTEAALITLLMFGLIVGTTLAAKGGSGKGPAKEPVGSCVVDGTLVHGSNLPVWELMNFMVTDASGTTGWVIGYTDTGERSINVPAANGPTRYEFAGRTYGTGGTKYEVYASCTVG